MGSTNSGTPSTSTATYNVSGSNLTADLVVTAPTNFQVSTSSTSGFGSSVTLTPSSGSISTTAIYVRLSGTGTGAVSGNVTNASTNATTRNVAVEGTVNSITPTITVSPAALNAFNTLAGTPSAAQSYTVGGSNLTTDITVTAPTGYEVSLSSGSGFGATVAVPQTGGTASSTVYVRLSGAGSGTVAGNLLHQATGATDVTKAVTGTVVAEPTTQPTVSTGTIGGSSVVLTVAGGDGTSRLLVIRQTSTGAVAPVDQTAYTANVAFGNSGTGTTTGAGNYVVLNGTATSVTVTGLTPNTAYTAEVYAYNTSATAGFENYLTTTPGTANFTTLTAPVAGQVVISQVYGGGGNSGSVYRNDFIELHNTTGSAISVSGWSVQYSSSSGTSWQSTPLTGTIPAYGYYLVQQAAGSGGTTALPTPDVVGTTTMSGTNGKVLLSSVTTAYSVSCPTADVLDLVGYGSSSCFEGSGPTASLDNNIAARRIDDCVNGNDNAVDFTTVTPPTPRNSSSTNNCNIVPTTYYAKATGALNDPATFGTNPDGSGTSPVDFTTNGQTFRVSGTGRTISAAWTVSGNGSKVVLDANAGFIIPAAFNFTGPLDLGAGSTLVVQNSTIAYTLGSVDATSTIDYAQSGTFALTPALTPTAGYGNLKLTNGTKTLPTGTTTVRGNLTVENVTGFAGFAGSSTPTFTTLNLAGNFTLLGTVTPGTASNAYTLQLTSSGVQTLTGNGNDINLFRLTVNSTASAALAATGTNLTLGNTSGGGLTLDGPLALNSNTITLIGNGLFLGEGVLTNATNGTINVAKSGGTNPGTIYFGTNETLGTLTLNPSGSGDELTLGSSLTVNNLNLTDGVLGFSGQTLIINGPVTVGTGQLRGAATSSLRFTGSGSIGALDFVNGTASLASLTLDRTSNVTINLTDVLTVGNVTLSRGALEFSASTRLVVTGSITGGNADSYVNALTLSTPANTTATLDFPLGGTLGFYRPVTLALTQDAATVTSYTARIQELPGTSRGVTAPLTNVSAVRYFRLSKETGGAAFTSGTITLRFGTDDGVNDQATLRVGSSANGNTAFTELTTVGITGSFPSSGFATGTITANITALGDFALATTATTPGLNPLPVELTSFTAQRQEAGVLLQWVTAQEKSSAYFEVQRSTDGHEFAALGTLAAAGTSTSRRTYHWVDARPVAGTAYYRLKQVDTDGSTAYSPVVVVQAGNAGLQLFPNPARQTLHVRTVASQQWRVLNLLGQPMLEGRSLDGQFSVDVSALKPGSYHLEVRTAAKGRVVQRFVKE
ncbi:lamin tail domain-containing protein [Hymenobacter gummosus]|uniref:lamin tail domain-containing protein n=1 Tax=Hymenobacter gummosus TaxID=1776032 RepID=UPI001A9E02BD|nr:lamin tail domain-containing protein [Hymenobacter gummosus]